MWSGETRQISASSRGGTPSEFQSCPAPPCRQDSSVGSAIIDTLTSADILTFADRGNQDAGGTIRTVQTESRRRHRLSRREKAVNRSHARIRVIGERAIATLKGWKILTKLRCCPRRATTIVQAIIVHHRVEARHHPRQNGSLPPPD